jgi:transposase-like protein
MGSILHGSAKTTPKIRKEIFESSESIVRLAKKYNLNPKTILKWKHRSSFSDRRSGPIKPRSVLSEKEQSIVCEFKRVTKFSLDEIFCALQDKIPTLSRSNIYRCLKRNGLNKNPKEFNEKRTTKEFKNYPIGFMHIDIAQVHTKDGKAYLFVGIDRKTRYVHAELFDKMTTKNTCVFLKNLIAHCPFKIHKILTDNGAQFTYKLLAKHLKPKDGKTHKFDVICNESSIEHRLTKFRHPWTNGLVERMNRTIKEATIKIYFYENLDELKKHLMLWLLYYNYEKKLKSLKFNSPRDKILEELDKNPSFFNRNPHHKIRGHYIASISIFYRLLIKFLII